MRIPLKEPSANAGIVCVSVPGLLHLTFEGYKKSTDYTNFHGGEFISPD